VLDVMLPGIDGYSLQLKISQDPQTKDMPIIVLTALEPSKTLFQKFPQVVGFMTKPFKTEDLLQAAQSAVTRAKN
jgi:CheY-like chemotaxis protein